MDGRRKTTTFYRLFARPVNLRRALSAWGSQKWNKTVARILSGSHGSLALDRAIAPKKVKIARDPRNLLQFGQSRFKRLTH